MYKITDAVYNCYTEIGRFRNIEKEVLTRRLSANVDSSTTRERIFENENKWIYKLGSCEIKVDHDTNMIYHIKWVENPLPISSSMGRIIEDSYRKYGLNKKGNQIIA